MAEMITTQATPADVRMLINIPITTPPRDGTVRPTSNRIRRHGRGEHEIPMGLDFTGFTPRWWMGQQGQ